MHRPLLLLFMALAWACAAAPVPPTAPTVGIARADDGVAIAYDVRGQGSTTLVLVHGWACDRTFWHKQLDALAQDYRVVTLDLGGHGASGKTRPSWSLGAFAGDVRAVVEDLGLRHVVLVGHSLGGPVCLEAARRMPDRVVAVVGVDTLHNVEQRIPEGTHARIASQLEQDFAGVMTGMVRSQFPSGADPALVEWVVARAVATDHAAMTATLRAMADVDLAASLGNARVPVRCINAAPDAQRPLRTDVVANRRHADFDAVEMAGVGHFLMLERPAEFLVQLRAFLQRLPG